MEAIGSLQGRLTHLTSCPWSVFLAGCWVKEPSFPQTADLLILLGINSSHSTTTGQEPRWTKGDLEKQEIWLCLALAPVHQATSPVLWWQGSVVCEELTWHCSLLLMLGAGTHQNHLLICAWTYTNPSAALWVNGLLLHINELKGPWTFGIPEIRFSLEIAVSKKKKKRNCSFWSNSVKETSCTLVSATHSVPI